MSGELRRLFIAGVLLIPGGGALAQAFDPPARATADGSALYAPRFYPGQLYARQFYRADRHTPASRRSSKPAPLDLSVVNTVGTNTVSEGDGGAVARPPAGAAARTAQPAGGKSQPKQKHGIFTWAIFGFTEGSDTDVPGGKSLYNQSDGRFARADAGYWALATNVGVNGGIKYQMLDRPTSGFGLAFQAAPYYTRTGLATGNATHAVGSEFRLLADTELVPP